MIYTLSSGLGFNPGSEYNGKKMKGTSFIPLTFYGLFGGKSSFAQLGVGYTAAFGPEFIDSTGSPPVIYKKFESAYIVSLGYRYMNKYGTILQGYPLLQWTNNPSNKFSFGFGFFFGFAF
ncbi:hypothetical protein [Pinibacter soli]|uniref:Outer membrane protein n=1 Tax=Pinibacter soli TaxID=3044211 RepID=A0ABT6R743_9BACT|nr:hypothetical protein [Pinibacter soli]MDI3318387.1 hypothetical protein [Pinibacter soli]